MTIPVTEEAVTVRAAGVVLEGDLQTPAEGIGVVLFAHGSGSSRHSPRNQFVATWLRRANLATLLIDLLTPEEEAVDLQTSELRFDIPLLAARLIGAVDWLRGHPPTAKLAIGTFGASTGAAAALIAAAERPDAVAAVVSRGGRPDLAGPALARVRAPTLLIVGSDDVPVIELNERAMEQLHSEGRLDIIPGATHLFEEPGALQQVAIHAAEWFARYLASDTMSKAAHQESKRRGA